MLAPIRARSLSPCALTAILLAGLACSAANADAERLALELQPEEQAPPANAPSLEPAQTRWHVKLALDYTTDYFFRGIRQEDRGFILQPAAEIAFDLHSADDASLSAFAGIWNSFHDRATGATNNSDLVDKWYESDLYAGLAGSLGDLSLSASYVFYTSPSGAFRTVQEVALAAAYDDGDLWGDSSFALNPSITLAFETAGGNADGGAHHGVYLQPGIAPGFTAALGALGDVDFSFPVLVGLSLSDYYEDAAGGDDAFGYASVGAKASFRLPVPDDFGVWTLSGGVQVLFLGDTLETINGGDDTQVIGTVGIVVNF